MTEEAVQTLRPDIETPDIPGYWEQSKDDDRWVIAASWVKFFSPLGLLVDVGCYDTEAILAGEAEERICIDLLKFPKDFQGTKIQEEWLKVQLPRPVDLLLCLETIEHQPDDEVLAFTAKLFADARLLIVSMPFGWPTGACSRHFQDPIDAEKFHRLMHKRRPLKMQDSGYRSMITRTALYVGDVV